jgi:hypothetical protein
VVTAEHKPPIGGGTALRLFATKERLALSAALRGLLASPVLPRGQELLQGDAL